MTANQHSITAEKQRNPGHDDECGDTNQIAHNGSVCLRSDVQPAAPAASSQGEDSVLGDLTLQ